VTEQRSSDEAAFSCSLSIYSDICRHTVRWLHEGNRRDVVTSRRPCSAWHIMKKSDLDQKTYELLKCEVTDGYSGRCTSSPSALLRPQVRTWRAKIINIWVFNIASHDIWSSSRCILLMKSSFFKSEIKKLHFSKIAFFKNCIFLKLRSLCSCGHKVYVHVVMKFMFMWS